MTTSGYIVRLHFEATAVTATAGMDGSLDPAMLVDGQQIAAWMIVVIS